MAEIYIKGRIVAVPPVRTGQTADGKPWEVQDYVIAPTEGGGRQVAFAISGRDRISAAGIVLNGEYVVKLYVESRSYPNKETGEIQWFTSVTFGGTYGLPHWQFYQSAMYSLRAPGFGVSVGYQIVPVQMQQQSFMYGGAHQEAQGYGQQNGGGFGSPSGGYGQNYPGYPQGTAQDGTYQGQQLNKDRLPF